MKTFLALISLLIAGGCAMRAKSSVAVVMTPASIRGMTPAEVAAARAKLETKLTRRGQLVTRHTKDADYWLHASYLPCPRYGAPGELVEVKRERNPMKEGFPPHDTLRVSPKITDEISGTPPPFE